MILTGQEELGKFLDRKGLVFAQALLNTVSTHADPVKHREALQDLAFLIQHTLILSNLHARKRVLMEADYVKRHPKVSRFTAIPEGTPIMPKVPFEEAIDRMLNAEPRLAASMEEVSRLYSESKAFAMARSASMEITKRVQKEMTKLLEGGATHYEVEKAILDIGQSSQMGDVRNWTRAYASTVYQTNAATSYTEGRFSQAKDEDVKAVVPAFIVDGIADDAERPNHRAARGLIAASDDPIWSKARPPYGYRCRHGVDFISKYELQRRGLFKDGKVIPYYPPQFSQFHNDPGFDTKRPVFGGMD